jgi:two-component sensor histidine kinase
LFSLILADRLKQLRLDKITSQKYLISYQAQEESRLTSLVEEKTSQLQCALKEKDLLLQELNHRVKNSIQTIVSFLRLQIDETSDHKMQQSLMHIENRILSISHLYSLLYAKHNHSYINAYEYFSLLVDNIQSTLHKPNIDITIDTQTELHSETAIYCGFIINEAVTNALQHAFEEKEKGHITVSLMSEEKQYTLSIHDDGKGFDASISYESLGLTIIESLATYQLHGTLDIVTKEGTQLIIKWEKRDE